MTPVARGQLPDFFQASITLDERLDLSTRFGENAEAWADSWVLSEHVVGAAYERAANGTISLTEADTHEVIAAVLDKVPRADGQPIHPEAGAYLRELAQLTIEWVHGIDPFPVKELTNG